MRCPTPPVSPPFLAHPAWVRVLATGSPAPWRLYRDRRLVTEETTQPRCTVDAVQQIALIPRMRSGRLPEPGMLGRARPSGPVQDGEKKSSCQTSRLLILSLREVAQKAVCTRRWGPGVAGPCRKQAREPPPGFSEAERQRTKRTSHPHQQALLVSPTWTASPRARATWQREVVTRPFEEAPTASPHRREETRSPTLLSPPASATMTRLLKVPLPPNYGATQRVRGLRARAARSMRMWRTWSLFRTKRFRPVSPRAWTLPP